MYWDSVTSIFCCCLSSVARRRTHSKWFSVISSTSYFSLVHRNFLFNSIYFKKINLTSSDFNNRKHLDFSAYVISIVHAFIFVFWRREKKNNGNKSIMFLLVYSTWHSYLEIVYDDIHYKTVGWCHHDLQENNFSFIVCYYHSFTNLSMKWE